ncbi:MAG TPA: murein biosynthesis integral membrane protein MurJ [Candidatus Saccharimonadales bacterium]
MTKAQQLLQKANQRFSVGLAATLLASSTLIAAVLGFYRDKLLIRNFLDDLPGYLDAYQAAFKIPDFMYFVLVSGALSVTFIPVFNARMSTGNKKSAWELSSSLFNLLAVVTMVVSVLIIIFADPLIRYVVAPGISEPDLAIAMMRIIAVNPFLFALSSMLSSMQQATGRFFFFTLAPIVYNIGIIIGILTSQTELSLFGVTIWEGGIMNVAYGVVLGSVLQLIVSSFGMIGMKFDYRPLIFWRNKGFQEVQRLLPPRSFAQGIDYFLSFVETNIASRMGPGVLSRYQYALTLHLMPINLIGVAISTAVFPQMSERLEAGRMDLFRKELQAVLRVIIWLALPVSLFIFLCRGYIVGILKDGGDNTIATILGFLVIAILFRSIYHIASRAFYAQHDTKTPLYTTMVAIALNIILAVAFFQAGYGPVGLALAQSIVAVVEVILLFFIMQTRLNNLLNTVFWRAIVKMLSATGLMAIVTYLMVAIVPYTSNDRTFFAVLLKIVIIAIVSFTSYIMFSHMFRLSEPQPIIAKFKKVIFRSYPTLGGRRPE